MNRLRVAVLMGGPSAERDVSLSSGREAARALTRRGMSVCEVRVDDTEVVLPYPCDVAFLALHGRFGEDGTVQRLLDSQGVLYTGSGPEASARAMDKAVAKECFRAAGVPTPRAVVVERNWRPAAELSFPAMVKPAREGSSLGISLIRDKTDLEYACLQAWVHDERLLIEEYIAGREFTVGILGDQVLPVIEIRTKRAFFDHRAKYTSGEAQETTADLDAPTAARIQAVAWQAHECLGCRDFSRVDLMMNAAGELFVLEVNTIPGLTPQSLLPKAAAATGLSFEDLCGRMVELALARAEQPTRRVAPVEVAVV